MNNCPYGKREPVIVFKSGNLYEKGCICLDSLVLRVGYWDAGIATRSHVTLYSIIRRLSMRFLSRRRQFRSFIMAVTIISIHQHGSPPLDGFLFLYISGSVGGSYC